MIPIVARGLADGRHQELAPGPAALLPGSYRPSAI
jgi:hypothetical protein